MNGNLLLNKSDMVNEIGQDNNKYYLNHKRKRSITEIINSEEDLKGKNIFSEIYILSQIIYGVILKWQTSYIDAFVGKNNSQNTLINCMKQLDKII